ncbi:MAG: hypothetical protein R6X17_06450 [Candidatus Competibacteraceae bacterium]
MKTIRSNQTFAILISASREALFSCGQERSWLRPLSPVRACPRALCLLLLGVLLVLGGPLAVGETETAEKALRARVEARWQALVARDFARAYEFQPPSYRALHTVREYASDFGRDVGWKGVRIQEIEYDETSEAATVLLVLDYQFFSVARGDLLDMERYLGERWVKEDGEWWYIDLAF